MRTLRPETIARCIAQLTGIPEQELTDPVALLRRLPDVERAICDRLIGQNEAVGAVTSALRARLLRNASDRPILGILCVGPSGVGKTELARLLASTCFGSDEALFRIDGSEYREPHSIARLIGAPPGYVGHGPGQLTEAVRRRPRSVVLMDEVEKASPEVLNAFLQILSAGRLTDAMGTTVDFRGTMAVLTSNLGNAPGGNGSADPSRYRERVMEVVRRELRPELLGRLDSVVVFRHLDLQDVMRIVRLQLDRAAEEMQGVGCFEVTDDALERLAAEAYSPDSGAREVERVIRARVDPAISALLDAGIIAPNDATHVRISIDADAYVFERI